MTQLSKTTMPFRPLRIGIFSLIPWDFIHQRPQKFAEELAALGHEVFYVEPSRVPGGILPKLTEVARARRSLRRVAGRIYVLRPFVIPPRRDCAHLLPLNRVLRKLAIQVLRPLRLDFAIVLSPEYGRVVQDLGVPHAYDHVDDTQYMEHVLTEQFVADMQRLKDSSAFNIYIQEVEASTDPKGICIPNGADRDQFYPLGTKKVYDAVVLSNIAKWFDMDSILESRHDILLIGPMDIDGGNNKERFLRAKRPNLLWIPQIDKELANLWLSRAHVGLVPFKDDHPVVRYAMPIKILEYFLAGLPVVTYRNDGIERMYGDMVTFYSRGGDAPRLDDAIALAKQKVDRGYTEFAARYEWMDIVGELERKIADHLGLQSSAAGRSSDATRRRRWAAPTLYSKEVLEPSTRESPPLATPSSEGLRLAYLGAIDWEYTRQRPQHLATELARYHHVSYVRPVPVSRLLRRRRLPASHQRYESGVDGVRPRALSPGRLGPVAYLNDLVTLKHLAAIHPDVLWLSHPSHLSLVGKCGEKLVVYDMMDNHVSFAPGDRKAATDLAERGLLRLSHVVFASSEGLRRRAEQYATGKVCLLPNGVDRDHFVKAATEPLKRPSDLPNARGFCLGFYGTLGPWIDVQLLVATAREHPEWELVLIGPSGGADLRPLSGMPNVHQLGWQPYEHLPAYLQHVHVWTLPFTRSPLTEDVDPVKIYEYLAVGKPVVATDLPALQKFHSLIYSATSAAEFVRGAELAYRELSSPDAPVLAQRRIAAVEQHTWRARGIAACRILQEAWSGLS